MVENRRRRPQRSTEVYRGRKFKKIGACAKIPQFIESIPESSVTISAERLERFRIGGIIHVAKNFSHQALSNQLNAFMRISGSNRSGANSTQVKSKLR